MPLTAEQKTILNNAVALHFNSTDSNWLYETLTKTKDQQVHLGALLSVIRLSTAFDDIRKDLRSILLHSDQNLANQATAHIVQGFIDMKREDERQQLEDYSQHLVQHHSTTGSVLSMVAGIDRKAACAH